MTADPGLPGEQEFQQGLLLHRQGQLDGARRLYMQALKRRPQHVGAVTLLGVLELQSNDPVRALEHADGAIRLEPRNAAAFLTQGTANLQLRRAEAAIASFDSAIALNPGDAQSHHHRGLALASLRRFDAAIASYERAIAADPAHAESHLHRGNALREVGRKDAALASVEHAIAIRGDFALAYANRGNLLSEMGRPIEALASYERAILLQPDHAEAHCNRGILHSDLGQFDAALASFNQAIAIDPGYAQAYFSRSLVSLLRGDFQQGWADFEWRWVNEHSTTSMERRSFGKPRWLGDASLDGKTILLHSEQGLGDTIQFCRYATRVADLGACVIVEGPGALAQLLASVDGVAQVVVRGEPLPAFDFHCPLLSLPLAFGTTLDSIPARVPYLHCGPEKLREWRERLGPRSRPRVGLVWSSGTRPGLPGFAAVNSRRNVPLRKLAMLCHPDIDFYSLQIGQPAESELALLAAGHRDGPDIRDMAGAIHDFTDTAALITQLDLLISVDTSTAHLAGALGHPVWLMVRSDACWRWLLDRSDSPWYPSLRIYRQHSPGDWDGPLARLRTDLAALVSQ